MKKLISVILAVYNEKHLQPCLESLDKQAGVKFEVIVVDDGSHKKIQKSIFKIQKEIFKFYKIKHSGPAIARNWGVKKSKGEILVFVDGDMEFEPEFLHDLTKPIQESIAKGTISTAEWVANWDNVYARCWNFENGLKTRKRIDEKSNMLKDFRAILKSEFDRVKGFDDTGYTDTWTLFQKLNYLPVKTQAKYYHYNPETLNEAFNQALWIGGRQRKFGFLGRLVAAIRATAFFSLPLGIIGSLRFRESKYLQFKMIYDLGILGGIIGSVNQKP